MIEQIELQKLLYRELSDIKVRNPYFTLRSYARRLNVPPSALSEILNGKRRVSKRMATRITDRLTELFISYQRMVS